MPVFEFQCVKCGKKCSLLVGMTAEPDEEVCPHCGSVEMNRLISRFRQGRNEDARVDEMADRLDSMVDPDSGSAMRGMVREMGRAIDDDLSDEMEEMFEFDMDNPELTDE